MLPNPNRTDLLRIAGNVGYPLPVALGARYSDPMSKRRRSARYCALSVMVVMGVSLLAPAARADSPEDVCTAFPHRQTYVAEGGMFRAPAWHYDETVTVVYDAAACDAIVTDAGNYVLTISGTATVYQGTDAEGKTLDERPFKSIMRSTVTDGKLGWPVAWWSCFEGSFSYVWTIEDVYTFAVVADDGRWVMSQKDPTTNDSDSRIVNGCRSR